MPIIASAGSGADFKPAPAGLHQAVAVDVVDLGILNTSFGDKHKVSVRWQLAESMEDGKPYLIQKRYTLSLHEKSVLRHDLESWRGRPFTAEELRGFDLEKLIGANCQLVVVHKPGEQGRVWANVQTIAPLAKGQQKIQPRDYIREQDKQPQAHAQHDEDDVPTDDGGVYVDDIPFNRMAGY
jgi:hypothetical protein